MKLISQGAEAKIYVCSDEKLLDEPQIKESNPEKQFIYKERFKKEYRIQFLDRMIRKRTFKLELNALKRCYDNGIPVPKVVGTNKKNFGIFMEYLKNTITLNTFLKRNVNSANVVENISLSVGKIIGKLHSIGIVHGDITTSNILVHDSEDLDVPSIFIIDFGLCSFTTSSESRAVDLYVFKRSLASENNSKMIEHFFENFLAEYDKTLKSYETGSSKQCDVLTKLNEVEKRGRKREMFG